MRQRHKQEVLLCPQVLQAFRKVARRAVRHWHLQPGVQLRQGALQRLAVGSGLGDGRRRALLRGLQLLQHLHAVVLPPPQAPVAPTHRIPPPNFAAHNRRTAATGRRTSRLCPRLGRAELVQSCRGLSVPDVSALE